MYKISYIDGQVLVPICLEDKYKNEFYSHWFFELYELENLFELEFKNKPSKEQLEKIIKQYAIERAETLINNYSVDSMDMIVEDKYKNDVDYRELELSWKGVDNNLLGLIYFDYENIEYIYE